jgi:hypothetical protein
MVGEDFVDEERNRLVVIVPLDRISCMARKRWLVTKVDSGLAN